MSMLKVAGTNADGIPKSFRTDPDGRAEVTHKWITDEIQFVSNVQIRGTEGAWSDRVDVGEYATISLRVYNSHDQPVTIIFGRDYAAESTTYLKNYGGSNIGFTIPADSGSRMITPEEFPFLQYLKNVKVRYECSTAPTSGALYMTIVGKR